jgi:1-acyl-sn-glycerol-3-phosphate acyltransferase
LRILLGPLFFWFYRLRAENLELFKRVKAPYLVIPNHVMTWDPLIFSYYVRDPIHFVASDANFRSSFFSWWLRRVGAIAKSKLMDDFATLRTIMDLLRSGKVVGLFAEGQRTWDGATQSIIPSTAKLVKVARVPVVVPVMKGGFHTLPRWAFRSRRGRITVEYRLALTAEEVKRFSLTQIKERIESVMQHDEDAYQAAAHISFTYRKAAEPMQLILFYCPSCETLNHMKSSGRLLFCTHCGYTVRFSAYARFHPVPPGATVIHRTIRSWSQAQNAFVESHLRGLYEERFTGEIFADDEVLYSTGYRMTAPHPQGLGRLALHTEGLRFHMHGNAPRFFRWSEIRGLNVVYQDQIEFYLRRRLCVFQFPRHDTSGYKYLLCGEKLAEMWRSEAYSDVDESISLRGSRRES